MAFERSLIQAYQKKQACSEYQAKEFAAYIGSVFESVNNYFAKDKINVLTVAHNASDGYGDFINQVDFGSWLIEAFEKYISFKVYGISILEAKKFDLSIKLMPPNVRANGVLKITTDADYPHTNPLEGPQNVLCGFEVTRGDQYFVSLDDEYIKELLSQADFVVNVARYFWVEETTIGKFLQEFDPRAYVISRGEYGPLGAKDKDKYGKKIYYENCMGVLKEQAGIKVYPELMELCLKTDSEEKKYELLRSFENQALVNALLQEAKSDSYFQTHGFAFGYIQDQFYSILFTRLMIAKMNAKTAGVTIIAELSHFKDIETNAAFMAQLRENQFGKIVFINKNGEKKEIEVSNATGHKELTLVDFRGTSQSDKNKMIALSDMVAGSGNSSFSEMTSSMRFPFIQPIRHVIHFYNAFIKQLETTQNEKAKELADYLKLLIQENLKEDEIQMLIAMMMDEALLTFMHTVWQNYCSYLAQKHNAYEDFVEFTTAFVLMKFFQAIDEATPGTMEKEIALLLKFLPDGKIAGTTLLHLAIERNLPSMVDILLKMQNVRAYLDEPCLYKNFTPLMVAARYQNYDYVDALLTYNANIDAQDSDGLTVVHHAAQAGDVKLMKLIIAYSKEINFLVDNIGKTPMHYAIDSKNQELIDFLLAVIRPSREEMLDIKNYAIENLPLHMLNVFGIGRGPGDVIGMANYAIEHNSLPLFRQCCLDESTKTRSDTAELAGMALKSDFEFAKIFLQTTKQPFEQQSFVSRLPFLIKSFLPKDKSVYEHLDLVQLQLGLIRLTNFFKRYLEPNGTTIRINQIDNNFLIALENFLNAPGSPEQMFVNKVCLQLCKFCLKGLETTKQPGKAAVQVRLEVLILKGYLQGFVEEFLSQPTNPKFRLPFISRTQEFEAKKESESFLHSLQSSDDLQAISILLGLDENKSKAKKTLNPLQLFIINKLKADDELSAIFKEKLNQPTNIYR